MWVWGCGYPEGFLPALDFDANGYNVVVYYDRQANCNNSLYGLRFVQADEFGSLLQTSTLVPNSQSDPATNGLYAPLPGHFFIGDYHGVWLEGTIVYTGWLGSVPNNQGDIELTRIQ